MKSVVVNPFYNKERTLARCIGRVRTIQDEELKLHIVIIDDFSADNSYAVHRDWPDSFLRSSY